MWLFWKCLQYVLRKDNSFWKKDDIIFQEMIDLQNEKENPEFYANILINVFQSAVQKERKQSYSFSNVWNVNNYQCLVEKNKIIFVISSWSILESQDVSVLQLIAHIFCAIIYVW